MKVDGFPESGADAQADALHRARARRLRVARLGDDTWRVESSEPHLRGPYLVLVEPEGLAAHCECIAGTYREGICWHRAAVLAARAGAYPLSDPSSIVGPGPAPDGETREQRTRRLIAEYDAASARRRATATVSAADYQMFD
jgi:hypothetical protein